MSEGEKFLSKAQEEETVEYEGKTYVLSARKIEEGDTVWNPVSDAIMEIDSEDDIYYVNDTYIHATEVETDA